MARKKKGELPSGNVRRLVYNGMKPKLNKDGSPVIDKDGKQVMMRNYISVTAESAKEAEYVKADIKVNKKNISKCNLTFGECLDKYIELRSSVLSPSTIREYKRSRKIHAIDLMDIKIKDITQELIQEVINKESVNHAPKTVRNIHGLISAVLNIYKPEMKLNTSLPQKITPNLYIPTDNDIKTLLDHVNNEDMMIAILLAAFGPMRRSEICALESSDITNKIIHVQRALVLNENKEYVIKTTKSVAGDRYIPLPDFVFDKIRHKKGRVVNLMPNQVSDRFIDIIKASGLPHFRFHDLRHYCASIQHAMGIPDAYIMQRGGWGSDKVLKQVYRHALSDKSVQMNDIANKHFEEICNTKCNTKK